VRRRTTLLAAVPVGLALLLGACGGDDGGETGGADVTLPSSLSLPPTSSTTATSTPTTASSPHVGEGPPATNPTVDGAPVIVSVRAEKGADACTDGTIPAVIIAEVEPNPPVRVFSAFLDGNQTEAAASATTPGPLTIPAVACDGAVHMVSFIALGVDGRASTQAVAFLAPRPT